MFDLQKYTESISLLCTKYSVAKLYAFGSVLNNRFNAESDIDLLVSFKHIAPEDYADNYFDLKQGLEQLLGKHVDMLEEQALKNPYLKKEIDQTKQLMYG